MPLGRMSRDYVLKILPVIRNDQSLYDEDECRKTIFLDTKTTAKLSTTLGRCEVTLITDKRCSRDHTSVRLDQSSEEVVFTQLGSNPSSVKFENSQEEYILCKHDVKRLSLSRLIGKDSACVLHLIHKDLLYAYRLIAEMKEDPETGKSTQQEVLNRSEHKKRKGSTLDNFVIKKVKTQADTKDMQGEWTQPDPMVHLYNSDGLTHSDRIAGFDMDSTLIVPASGAKWPKSKDDWKLMFPTIPSKLRQLFDEGYKIVIFTNQAGIARGTVKASDIQHKIEAVISKIGLPMQAMIAACKNGVYRKPSPGMWHHICNKANSNIKVDTARSIYVGDAAGRVVNWQPGKKKDFSISDRLFALNIGVSFHTPESFFLDQAEGKYDMPEFKPSESLQIKNLLEPSTANLTSASQELIVMVGFPGSGKSYFSTHHLKDYVRVNRDTLGSWQKCVARCEQELKTGKSVVVDNTNPDLESRSRYVDVAKKHQVPVRCFLMTTSYKQARHNECFRQLTDSKHKPINDMVVNSYKSKYTEPTLSEGFIEIVKVNVVLKFSNNKDKELYSSYLLEK